MTQAPTSSVQLSTPAADDEIDLRQLAAALRRRWALIAAGAVAGGLGAGLLTLLSKPVWEGEFQIVLSQKQSGGGGTLASLAASNPMLASLAGLGGAAGGSELTTEVKILESPSVLRPVFDLVKTRKASSGLDVSGLRFASWVKGSLSIELERGTSVLSIAYRDTDKALVLPVMQQISQAYQQYSGRDRSESISNGLSYAKDQVAQFRQKAAASNRALDAFSIRYGISSDGRAISSSGIDVSKFLNSGSNGSIGSVGSVGKQGDALGQLAAINQQLISRQQQFTNRDPGVQALIRERNALRRYIEMTAGGSLALPGQQPESKEQAQELILKFQELERTAKRDTATLDSLESTLLSLQLEQARSTKPWELISKPTLLDKPVSPRPARNLALGLLAGLVAGSGAALVVDRRSGRVFSEEELQQYVSTPLLIHLDPETLRGKLALLSKGALTDSHRVALIPVGLNAKSSRVQWILTELKEQLPHTEITCSRDLVEAASCDHQLLITRLGSPTRLELDNLQQQLNLQNRPITGWLLIEEQSRAA